MKPARAELEHHAPPDEGPVVITWTPEVDARRFDRLVAILQDIIDTAATPEEARRS